MATQCDRAHRPALTFSYDKELSKERHGIRATHFGVVPKELCPIKDQYMDMISNTSNLENLQKGAFKLGRTSNKMSLSDVFIERRGIYLNEFTLFMAHFNAIPNFIHEVNIDCKKANQWFSEKYASQIKEHYCTKRYFNGSEKAELDDIFYFLYEDLIVDFDTNQSIVRFLYRKTCLLEVNKIIEGIHKFTEKREKRYPKISLLINSNRGIDTKSLHISRPRLSIEDNYNDDFLPIHKTILNRLLKKNDKGLVLLHGKPGTGKTSYIRYLISLVKKDVIFLPPSLATGITSPNLMTLLIDNPNSVFVIEDAEHIVMDREKNGNSPVSALLNISDGLLSDCLNIQIICSFNIDISKIDSALMRKGRLIAKYEFKELEVEKAQLLSTKLGFSSQITSPMTLTSIYNQDERDFQLLKGNNNAIGFTSTKHNN